MGDSGYRVGMIVAFPAQAGWGPGKVLRLREGKAKVYFRDDPERRDFRTIPVDRLQIFERQTDRVLDNLPPFVDDHFDVSQKRVTIAEGIERFRGLFPKGFHDEGYVGTGKLGAKEYGERQYKLNACARYAELIGNDAGPSLLRSGGIEELVRRACHVVTKDLNLLSPFENMAFHDALVGDHAAATRYFEALFAMVLVDDPTKERFEALASAVTDLPAEKGKARVATWPVLSILPALADPTRFIFVKPSITQDCAERLRFEIQYAPQLRWITYQKVLEMADLLLEQLRPDGAKDYVDVQSFMWVIARQ